MKTSWYVYILECSDKSLYTGITNDLNRRLKQHQSGNGGHYTSSFGAKDFVYTEKHRTRSEALKREKQIKRWTRLKKDALIEGKLAPSKKRKKRSIMDKKELYEKTEKALNHAFETAKQSVKVLSEKAGEAAHVTKLLIEKATLEHKLSKKFTDLGHEVYQMTSGKKKTISLEDETVKVLIAEAKEIDKQHSSIEGQIEKERKNK